MSVRYPKEGAEQYKSQHPESPTVLKKACLPNAAPKPFSSNTGDASENTTKPKTPILNPKPQNLKSYNNEPEPPKSHKPPTSNLIELLL